MTAERETCALLQKGVAAIFGPQNEASASHIRSITDVAEIPFIDTRWHMQPVNPILTTSIGRSDYTVNLHPDASTLSKFRFHSNIRENVLILVTIFRLCIP